MIVHPWVRATTAGTTTNTGYAKIINRGAADRLIGASLSGANGVILSTTVVAGIAKVQPLSKGVRIGRGQSIELEPGGTHIVFDGLTITLDQNTYVEGTLTFEKAGTRPVECFVEPAAQAAPSHNGHEHGKHGKGR